jgi:hypothetical protein
LKIYTESGQVPTYWTKGDSVQLIPTDETSSKMICCVLVVLSLSCRNFPTSSNSQTRTFDAECHLLLNIRLEEGVVVLVRRTTRGLEAVHVVAPPGTSRPPGKALPDISVGLHKVKHVLDSSFASLVGTTSKLADHADLLVVTEPLGSSLETLNTDCCRNTVRRGTGAVRVQVLVHLVDDLVLRVSQCLHVVIDVGPRPGAGPLVALNEDVLSGACSANTVDGGLVEVENESLVHGVVLVVSVEHDAAVALELSSKVLPPGLKVRCGSDNLVEVTTVVVRVEKNSGSLAGDVVDDGGEVFDVR